MKTRSLRATERDQNLRQSLGFGRLIPAILGRGHGSDLVHGRAHAGLDRAIRLAELTGSPMEIWQRGGDVSARRPALEAWHMREKVSG